MAKFTRGFAGNTLNRDARLPPGQYDTGARWPVLTAEATPRLTQAEWTMSVDGLVSNPSTWTWDEILGLPGSAYTGDIHCVTSWSKLGVSFGGISVDTLLSIADPKPTATHAIVRSHSGYTANLAMEDLAPERAWIVWEVDGDALPRDHGGPARLVVPHLYFWKSVKWVAGIQLLDHQELGFWERNGYHDRGDPWLEQRYEGD